MESASRAEETAGTAVPQWEHFKPHLHRLLHALRLDVTYERGAGDFLLHRDDHGGEVEVLDMVGGYGSLMLGHAHPALVEEARRFLASGRPIHAQGSVRECASRLAAELSRRAGGGYCAVFANSGAEAVEAALKHAMLETGGRTFIALDRAFHGKTLGALQLTANPQHREPFELPCLRVLRIAPNNTEQLEAAFAEAKGLAGLVFEPVQGEGGVFPLSPAFARRASELCAQRGVPLIADECQTGLGRTGFFLASESLGVRPDYVVLSKALGGGLAKISAMLVRRERHVDEFDLKHTSTYADDDFSCAIALKTLELIDDALLGAVREKGARLLDGLLALARRHPGVIASVRGAGLMIGVEFRRLIRSPSFLLRHLSSQDDLAFLLTGYLLHAHRIRVAPTLSDRFTLRLQPSALISDGNIERVLVALEDVCERIAQSDAAGLAGYLAAPANAELEMQSARTDWKLTAYDAAALPCHPERSEGSLTILRARSAPSRRNSQRSFTPKTPFRMTGSGTRVAWLCHLVDNDDLLSLEPAFGALPAPQRENLIERMTSRAIPVVMSAVDMRSATGARVRFFPIMLPFTSRWVKRRLDAGRTALPQSLVQQGIECARALGCGVVSLGQYTSIVTLNGLKLDARGIGITTGNSYAIALALDAIDQAHRETGTDPRESTLVVAGAAGNIGSTCARMLAPRYRRVILVGSGRSGAGVRLRRCASHIPGAEITTHPAAIREGDVVVVALNAVDQPLGAGCFAANAIVCDLSIPAGMQVATASSRPDLMLIKGGIARLPRGEDFGIVGFPLAPGLAYGCIAEALLLGFEGVCDSEFTGSLTAGHVRRVQAMAARHGFLLADYKTDCASARGPKEALHAIGG